MKFAALALFAVLDLSTHLGIVAQPANDECWDSIQVTCGGVYTGSTAGLAANPPTDQLLVGSCRAASTDYKGVWYKISTGADTFQLTVDTCSSPFVFDTQLSLLKGDGCTEVSSNQATMGCVLANDDTWWYPNPCGLQSIIGPESPSEDSDYWIYVHGWAGASGAFELSITCDPISPDTLLAPIDPWFIERSAFPPPEVSNVDPLRGGTWLELSPDRVQGTTVPALTATAHALPPNPNQRCEEGAVLTGVSFTATPCLTGTCPELMNPASVAVQQSFEIPDAYAMSPSIWTPGQNGENGQFNFCVHSQLKADFDGNTGLDEVSYIDTYYVVEVDYTSGFLVNVATFDRNPANVQDLFDSFRVRTYVCDDANGGGVLNTELVASSYLVGENVRLCVVPAPEFANFQVVSFNGVTCTNPGQTRAVIANGVRDPLTTIDNSLPPLLALETVVTEGFADGGNSFACEGSVELAPAGRRLLQEGQNVTGSFKVQVTIAQEGLSTGAIVGIVFGAFAVFLVLLLVLYRRGCFEKQKQLPKTVAVEESSETASNERV